MIIIPFLACKLFSAGFPGLNIYATSLATIAIASKTHRFFYCSLRILLHIAVVIRVSLRFVIALGSPRQLRCIFHDGLVRFNFNSPRKYPRGAKGFRIYFEKDNTYKRKIRNMLLSICWKSTKFILRHVMPSNS